MNALHCPLRGVGLAIFILATASLCGCAALTSTTHVSGKALGTLSDGLNASTQASVTRPDGVQYAQARVYVASQIPMIRREAATGGGDNIRALAALMGESDSQAFGQWMQANYARLFNNLDQPEMLVARIDELRHPTRQPAT